MSPSQLLRGRHPPPERQEARVRSRLGAGRRRVLGPDRFGMGETGPSHGNCSPGRRFRVLAIVVLAVLVSGWVAARGVSAAAVPCSDNTRLGLAYKDGWSGSATNEVPVVLIHGKGGSPAMWSEKMEWASGTSTTELSVKGDSYVNRISRISGTVVYTFDYEDYHEKWVTHSQVGPKLRDAIDCLYEEYEKQVVVVGHSMGSLAAQYVAKQNKGDDPQIGLVISLNTPYRGSHIANRVFPTVIVPIPPYLIPTDRIVDWKANRRTPAGLALRTEAENTRLPILSEGTWNNGFLFDNVWHARRYAIATNIVVDYPIWKPGYNFEIPTGVRLRFGRAPIGDMIVLVHAAIDGLIVPGRTTYTDAHVEQCGIWALNKDRLAKWVLGQTPETGQLDKISDADYLLMIVQADVKVGCYHSNMTRIKTIRDKVTARISEYIKLRITKLTLTDTATEDQITLSPVSVENDSPGNDHVAVRYTAVGPKGTEQITIRAVPASSSTNIKILPTDADPDTSGHQIDLKRGTTTITITTSAPSTTTPGNAKRQKVHSIEIQANIHGEVHTSNELFTQVSSYGGHTCAVTTSKAIICWGNNDDGQATAPTGEFRVVSAGSGAFMRDPPTRTGRSSAGATTTTGRRPHPQENSGWYPLAGSIHAGSALTGRVDLLGQQRRRAGDPTQRKLPHHHRRRAPFVRDPHRPYRRLLGQQRRRAGDPTQRIRHRYPRPGIQNRHRRHPLHLRDSHQRDVHMLGLLQT